MHCNPLTARVPGEATARPGAMQERLFTLDFVRGVAVLGILYANIVAYSQPFLASVWPGALTVPMDGADRGAWVVQFLLVDGKMRGLFAMLFGASMVLFTEAKGAALQARRLAWLGLFGLAHYFLLFRGDILFSYAVCGLAGLALGVQRLGAVAAFAAGTALYLFGAAFSSVIYLPELRVEHAALAACSDHAACLSRAIGAGSGYWDGLAGELAAARHETAVMLGSWTGIVGYNWSEHASGPLSAAFVSLFESFPAMLIGIGFFRMGVFSGRVAQGRLLGWGIAGLAIGLLLTWPLAAWLMREDDPRYLSYFVLTGPAQAARLPMILGFAAILSWLAPRMAQGWLGIRLMAAGRTAFSNYVGMSLVMAVVFQGWGLGLFGQLGRAELLVPVALGWALMLVWPLPWLARFRYGPLEWLWRCLTFGRILPVLRR